MNAPIILIVDDEEDIRGLMPRQLKLVEQCLTAANGQEALEIIGDTPTLQLVITDVDMPVMNGFELARAIRSGYAHLKVLGITGRSTGEQVDEMRKAGCDDVLPKPYTSEKLVAKVREFIIVAPPAQPAPTDHSELADKPVFSTIFSTPPAPRSLAHMGEAAEECLNLAGQTAAGPTVDGAVAEAEQPSSPDPGVALHQTMNRLIKAIEAQVKVVLIQLDDLDRLVRKLQNLTTEPPDTSDDPGHDE